MSAKTLVSILAGYFNTGSETSVASEGGKHVPATKDGVPSKRALKDFQEELKALSGEEKRELADLVCAVTGDSIKE